MTTADLIFLLVLFGPGLLFLADGAHRLRQKKLGQAGIQTVSPKFSLLFGAGLLTLGIIWTLVILNLKGG